MPSYVNINSYSSQYTSLTRRRDRGVGRAPAVGPCVDALKLRVGEIFFSQTHFQTHIYREKILDNNGARAISHCLLKFQTRSSSSPSKQERLREREKEEEEEEPYQWLICAAPLPAHSSLTSRP